MLVFKYTLSAIVIVAICAASLPIHRPKNIVKKLFRHLITEKIKSIKLSDILRTIKERSSGAVSSSSTWKSIAKYTPLFSEWSTDPLCQEHSRAVLKSMLTEKWAISMLDATGKLPAGVLQGNFMSLGNYDECIGVRAALPRWEFPQLKPDQLNFTGQYVTVLLSLNVTNSTISKYQSLAGNTSNFDKVGIDSSMYSFLKIIVGICTPSSCSAQDTAGGINLLVQNVGLSATASWTSTEDDSVSFTTGDIVVMSVCGVIALLMVVGTVTDVYCRFYCHKERAGCLQSTAPTIVIGNIHPPLHPVLCHDVSTTPAKPIQVLTAFSIYTNANTILNCSTSQNTLTCLHGIRFLSMSWVVIGHTVGNMLSVGSNLVSVIEWTKNPLFAPVSNAFLSVDSFFLLSGVLLSYIFCNTYQKNKHFNLILFYGHRVMRLTPPLALVVAVTATWFRYVMSGPLWNTTVTPATDTCSQYWWRTLLYIQNIFEPSDTCLIQTWYLANDMQMYLFSPLVLLPLVWKPFVGQIWLLLAIVVFVIARTIMWAVNNYPPTILMDIANPDFFKFYESTWSRCPAWLVGIGIGFLLHRLRGRIFYMPRRYCLLGWTTAAAVGVAVVYGVSHCQLSGSSCSKALSVAYGGFHRTAWALALGWVIFACATGYGGFVNALLSHPVFIPLSRLTYVGYLIHYNILQAIVGSSKGTIYLDGVRITYGVLGTLVITFMMSFVVSLAFEAPFINLEKLLLSKSNEITTPVQEDNSRTQQIGSSRL